MINFINILSNRVFSKENRLIVFYRFAGILAQFFGARLFAGAVGVEKYGEYVFYVSIISSCGWLDLGLGMYFQNYIARQNLRPSSDLHPERLIGPTLIYLCFLEMLLLGVLIYFLPRSWYPNGLTYVRLLLCLMAGVFYALASVALRQVFVVRKGEHYLIPQIVLPLTGVLLVLLSKQWGGWEMSSLAASTLLITSLTALVLGVKALGGFALFSWRFNISNFGVWINGAKSFWLYSVIGLIVTQLDGVLLGSARQFKVFAVYTIVTKFFFGGCYSFISAIVSTRQVSITVAYEQMRFEDIKEKLFSLLGLAVLSGLGFSGLFFIFRRQLIQAFLPDADLKLLSGYWVYVFIMYFIIRLLSDCYLNALLAISDVTTVNIVSSGQALLVALLMPAAYGHFGITGLVGVLFSVYLGSLLSYSRRLHDKIKICPQF